MKNKKKLIMDLFLAIALGLCMAYTFTGGLLHEIIGIVLLLGLLIHMFRRVKYYPSAIKALRKGTDKKIRLKALFAINIILIFVTLIMLMTSILISKELFSFIDFSFIGIGYEMQRLTHVICGIVMVVCAFLHVCLHFKLFDGIVRKAVGRGATSKILNVCSRVIAIAMAVIIVRVSISTAANAADIYKYFTGNDEAVKKSASAAGDLVTEKSAVDANKAESKSETADENNEQQLLAVISEDSNLTDENEKNELSADANKETKKTNPIAVKGKDIRLLFWTDEKQIKEVSEEEDPSTDTENNLEENADDYSGADVNTGDYSGDIFYDEDEYVYYDDDYSDEWYYDDTDDYYYVPTLSDYLAMFTCSGCGRHCSLLSPGCGKGAQQASQYTQEYYSVYGA